MVWYDNEWSYSSQVISLLNVIDKYEINPYFIDKQIYSNKDVMLRLDLNVPILNNTVTNDYRIVCALPTINRILRDNPKRLIIMSHLGRPTAYDSSQSLNIILPILKKHLNIEI